MLVRAPARVAAALAGIGIYAFLALSSGLDRIAAADDDPAVPTLWPFHAGAARAAAGAAAAANNPAVALAEAREAVRQDPLDARSAGLLGQAALATGDTAYAARVFGVAARLGWREPLTQAYALQQSLMRQDYHAAGDHLDALLRQSPDFAGRNLLLAPFDAAPVGRAELATRLAARPAWAQAYFGDTAAAEAGDPLARGEVAMRLARGGQRDCALVAPVMAGLLRHGHYGAALAIHAAHCDAAPPGSAATMPVDGRFVHADQAHPPTALDWHFADDGALSVGFERRSDFPGRAAIVGSAVPATLAFAEQPIIVAPGTVIVTWRARDTAGTPSSAIEVAVACDDGGAPWLAKSLVDRTGAIYQATMAIPAGCTRQRLVLGIAGGASGVAVGDIRVRMGGPQKAAAKLDNPGPAG